MDEDGLFAMVAACRPASLYPDLDEIGRGLLQSALQLSKSGCDTRPLGVRVLLNTLHTYRRLLVTSQQN